MFHSYNGIKQIIKLISLIHSIAIIGDLLARALRDPPASAEGRPPGLGVVRRGDVVVGDLANKGGIEKGIQRNCL